MITVKTQDEYSENARQRSKPPGGARASQPAKSRLFCQLLLVAALYWRTNTYLNNGTGEDSSMTFTGDFTPALTPETSATALMSV